MSIKMMSVIRIIKNQIITILKCISNCNKLSILVIFEIILH